MRPETSEWIAKADADFRTARRELSAPDRPNFDAVCFHAQQSAEKYLKARLVESAKSFPKIHDLDALLDLVLPLEPSWESLREDVQHLTDMAVEFRYPGVSADQEDASEALQAAEHVQTSVRSVLGVTA